MSRRFFVNGGDGGGFGHPVERSLAKASPLALVGVKFRLATMLAQANGTN
ncbi:MAG: hypothetical protein MPL62_10745 [Alphaproteobacteria bacterium]|nr:hypothetical protein [Alphaproteobacteria bacterium]